MDPINLQSLLDEIVSRAEAVNFQELVIENVDNGYGWEPTVALNCEGRRVHFYFNFFDHDRLTTEIALNQNGQSTIMRTAIATADDAWEIVDAFLRCRRALNELPSQFQWEHGAHGRSHS